MPEKLRVLDLFSGIRSVASPSDLSEPEVSEPLRSASQSLIAEPSLPITGLESPDSRTFDTSTQKSSSPSSPLTLSAADFPARTLALLETERDSTEQGQDSTGNTYGLLASYDHDGHQWKMSQRSLFEDSDWFSESWPRSGMTRNGIAYQLPVLAPLTVEIEHGFLPTPSAREGKDQSQASILASLDRGDGVAKKICALSPMLRSSTEIVGLHPSFAEWMLGYAIGFTVCERWETPCVRKSPKSSGAQSSKQKGK